ncbi:MAG: dTDP-4-dehydrorhamnose reductase [Actinomycetota bacterium]|nr:MAG: dTDP-4-dehydrorhamnose reductase [Actinomycetota bacterium]
MAAVPGPAQRWLVVGHLGMLGHDVMAVLTGRDVVGVDRDEIDIVDPGSVDGVVDGYDVVVNCAAWTAVDAAEEQEAAAFAVNAVGPANLARACARTGARLVQISTDYVFAGDAASPYAEDAAPAPRSAYGRTKAAGEWAVQAANPGRSYLVRTAWLYGEHGPNFPATMARLQQEKDTLDVVDDQRGQPTWSRDLAAQLVRLVDAGAPAGTYHGTASGEATWYDLARAVFALVGADPGRVRPTTSAAFVRPAPRPSYSVLGHDGWARAGLAPMRDWREALQEAAPTVLPGFGRPEGEPARR